MDTSFHFQAHSNSKTEYDQPMQFIDKPVNTDPIEQNIMLYGLVYNLHNRNIIRNEGSSDL